jgi:manganese/zinc/iron transport system substrate-binding protein
MIKNTIIKFSILGLCLGIWACGKQDQKSEKKLVVCTSGFVGDAVENLLKDAEAQVVTLMGAGVDPHTYKPSQGDMQNLMQADVIVYNGLHLEGNMANVLEKLSASKKIIAMGEGLNKDVLLSVGEGLYDPHIWFDALLWEQALGYTAQKLIEFLPEFKSKINANYLAYSDSLALLHTEISQIIFDIPKNRRILITSHDAFRYFGRAYQLEVKGLQGISTLSEPTLADITALVNLICERKIKAIFVESSVSRQAVLSVIEGCKAKGHDVRLGGELFSDALGKKQTPEGTYSGVMRANANLIVSAL